MIRHFLPCLATLVLTLPLQADEKADARVRAALALQAPVPPQAPLIPQVHPVITDPFEVDEFAGKECGAGIDPPHCTDGTCTRKGGCAKCGGKGNCGCKKCGCTVKVEKKKRKVCPSSKCVCGCREGKKCTCAKGWIRTKPKRKAQRRTAVPFQQPMRFGGGGNCVGGG